MRIDTLSIWALFFGTIIVVMIAIEAGYRLGHRSHRRSEDEKESPVSAIAAAILGLAAFMLAFTFGIVSERYYAKMALVREDADAIRDVWERSDFLPDADGARTRALLREYVESRVTFAEARSLDPQRLKDALSEARRIQKQLWLIAVAHGKKDLNSDIGALYVEALNEMNAVHEHRVSIGIQARVPVEIWITLYFVTILGMVGVGYQTGIAGSKRSMAGPLLAVSFALVFGLIASLDHPDSGIMKVTQQPLIDLREQMRSSSDGRSSA
jgi:hypothetical protein